MMDIVIALISFLTESFFILWFLYDYTIRGGRGRRVLWKVALWMVLITPGVAIVNHDGFTSQEQADFALSLLASMLATVTIWVMAFDPHTSRLSTFVQLGTLIAGLVVSAWAILEGSGGISDDGSWDEEIAFMKCVPAIVGKFVLNLPWTGPGLFRAFCWAAIREWVSRHDADKYYPPERLQFNRTLKVNGTLFAIDQPTHAVV